MTISKMANGTDLTVSLIGRLDTTTAPELEQAFSESLEDAKTLVVDLSELEYISSAGLRVILSAHKMMSKKGGMTVRGANETVMEIFDVTGFTQILSFE